MFGEICGGLGNRCDKINDVGLEKMAKGLKGHPLLQNINFAFTR